MIHLQEGSVRNQLSQRGLRLQRHAKGYTVKHHDHRELDTVEVEDLEDAYYQGLKLAARIDAKRRGTYRYV